MSEQGKSKTRQLYECSWDSDFECLYDATDQFRCLQCLLVGFIDRYVCLLKILVEKNPSMDWGTHHIIDKQIDFMENDRLRSYRFAQKYEMKNLENALGEVRDSGHYTPTPRLDERNRENPQYGNKRVTETPP